MGRFVPFMLSTKTKPAFIKNEKNYNALYIAAHYRFPGRNLKPSTKKWRLKQDYTLRVTLLIMSSLGGSLCFLFARFKTGYTQRQFLKTPQLLPSIAAFQN